MYLFFFVPLRGCPDLESVSKKCESIMAEEALAVGGAATVTTVVEEKQAATTEVCVCVCERARERVSQLLSVFTHSH